MLPWSDNPIHFKFKVKFFLDTNILSYLVDKTYSGLSETIKFLVSCDLIELRSSHYVIFEFVGIRKKEHFMRSILKKNTNNKSGKINLSSLLKYREGFAHDGLDYYTESKSIRKKVMREVEKITNEFQVDYITSEIHNNIWKPTYDVLLSSKVSKEDTLVTISSIFPTLLVKETGISLLTNDKQFEEAFIETSFKNKVNAIFRHNEITKPEIINIKKLSVDNTFVNLTDKKDNQRAKGLILNKIKKNIKLQNSDFFIGETIGVPNGAPQNTICFQLPSNCTLYENIHLVFIGKDLDFIYTTKSPVANFLDHMVPLAYPYTQVLAMNLAFLLQETDENGHNINHTIDILQKLRQSGNLLFIHPDTVMAE